MAVKKIFYLLIIFIFVGTLSGCGKKNSEVPAETKITPTEVPQRPIEETIQSRPYVLLLSSSDGHWLTLEVKNIPKGTTGLEYELTYFADAEGSRIERGVSTGGKPVDLNNQVDYSKKLLLGSASCTTGTCKYKYDENVAEGMLIIKLINSQSFDKYESAFRIQRGKEAIEGLSAGNGEFVLVSTVLPQNSLYLTISSIGIPTQLPEEVIAKTVPYSVSPNIAGKGTVSFKTSLTDASIYALVGKTWQKLPTTLENGKATADFSTASLFILGQ